jgi:hypothetical protein
MQKQKGRPKDDKAAGYESNGEGARGTNRSGDKGKRTKKQKSRKK